MSDIEVFVSGSQVGPVLSGTSTHRLNKMGDAVFTMPIDSAVNGIGKRAKIVWTELPNPIDMHGFIVQESAEDDENGDLTVEYTIQDPREMWKWRPARNGPATSDPGNYIKPTFFSEIGQAPQIMEDIFTQSIDDSDPALGDGQLWLEMGSFATGGIDLTDPGPTDNPMTIEEIATLLISTGALDLILTYIDSFPNMARIDGYNGNYGTDLSGTVSLDYATGQRNAAKVTRTRDLTNVTNKLRYLLAPKIDEYRYRRSIEQTNAGSPPPIGFPFSILDIIFCNIASRIGYGVRSDIKIWDSFGTESSFIPLYQKLWAEDNALRCIPRTLVNITPEDGYVPQFDIGDLIGVNVGSAFMGGFSGKQRIYSRAISWDENKVVQTTITASDDAP